MDAQLKTRCPTWQGGRGNIPPWRKGCFKGVKKKHGNLETGGNRNDLY